MNTETINIKVDRELKKEAQKAAKEVGLSLSAILKGYLRQFIETKKIEFNAQNEEPAEYLVQMLQDSDQDVKAGRVISFKNWEEEKKYLEDKIARNEARKNSKN